MAETERGPCPACAEPIALEARICPHCRSSVLVDLVLARPLPESRERFQLARALAALAPAFGGFAAVQRRLSAGGSLAAGLTRGEVRAADALFARLAPGVLTTRASSSVPAAPARDGQRHPPGRGARHDAGSNRRNALVAGAIVALASCAAGALYWLRRHDAPAPAAPAVARSATPAAPKAMTTSEVAKLALPATVSLRCADSVGAGFFVARDVVLTNAHVLCGEGQAITVVFSDGRSGLGSVVRRDTQLDLGLLKVAGAGVEPLALGDAGSLSVGDKVVMIGSPVGMEFTVHEASISNLSRQLFGVSYLQLEAKVNPGNSGGPIVDGTGRVVGVVSLKRSDAEGIGLALPINYAFRGSEPLVAAPAELEASAGFDAMLAQAEQTDTAAREELAQLELHPLVLAATLDAHQRVVVKLGYPAKDPPGYQEFHFKVNVAGKQVCRLTADVTEWKLREQAARPDGQGLQSRALEWLEKLGFDVEIYEGETALMMTQCGPVFGGRGTELELEDADPRAAKVPLG
ncbi:MAG: trypsin-like peptidase domain-containing protein [Vicinamibacteria bacterium]